MKALALVTALACILAGCDPAPQEANPPKPEPTFKTNAVTKPSSNPAPDTSAQNSGEVNPNRAYQLGDLEVRTVSIGQKPIRLWIMDEEGKRAEGMMFLKDQDVREDQGMLFVFPKPQTDLKHGFWMHNTLIPLDIIFVAAGGKVVNIQHGKPQDDTNLPPTGAYQYVVELKGGQAQALGLKSGDKIEIPKEAKATE